MYEVSSPFRKLACCARRFMPLWRNTPAYLARTTPAGSPNCCFACHPSVRSVSSAWSTCSFTSSSARSEQSKISSRRCWSHHRILRSRRCAASWGTPICERKTKRIKTTKERIGVRIRVEFLIRDARQFLYCDVSPAPQYRLSRVERDGIYLLLFTAIPATSFPSSSSSCYLCFC